MFMCNMLMHYAVIKAEYPSLCDIAMLGVEINTKTVPFHTNQDPFNKIQSNAYMHQLRSCFVFLT